MLAKERSRDAQQHAREEKNTNRRDRHTCEMKPKEEMEDEIKGGRKATQAGKAIDRQSTDEAKAKMVLTVEAAGEAEATARPTASWWVDMHMIRCHGLSKRGTQIDRRVTIEPKISAPGMGRGKIEIKRIENATNRQVTYSKRRTGIMKKARELTVLCDAQVAIIMFSSTGKYHEFCSPSTDIKGIFDRYQQAVGTSLWVEQYENMQRTLSHLKDINRNLRTEIRQRMGEDLDVLEFDELRGLEQNVDAALKEVRHRKYHVITTQTETYKKKVKHSYEAYKNLQQELGLREEPAFGFVDNTGGGWDGGAGAGAGAAADMYAFRVVPSQPNLHGMAYGGNHDLRLG